MSLTSKALLVLTGLVAAVICVLTFERPPVLSTQNGFRGTAMEQLQNPRRIPATLAANRMPEAPDAADTDGDKAKDVYENVKVLGELSVAQFGRIMQSMTEWIAPQQGCAYCHNPENLADDSIYTKVVARRMLQMTRTINMDWTSHVAQTGVTCYTCHRGQPVPAQVWSTMPDVPRAGLAGPTGQNLAAPMINNTSLPFDPFTPFLLNDRVARAISGTSLPGTNPTDVRNTEWTYSLMVHMSQSLGVNCTFCHNTRAFANWEQSPPQRLNAWHGIRMVQTMNRNYIEPLTPIWAANPRGPADGPHMARIGPHGDALKVNCATCHQGVNRPLLGAPMARDYPELGLVSMDPIRSAEATPR